MEHHHNLEAHVCKRGENEQTDHYDLDFQIGLYRLFFDRFIPFHAECENGNHRECNKTNREKYDINEPFHNSSFLLLII